MPVVGAIARKGNVTCQVIDRASASLLTGFVKEVVSDKVSLVATDDTGWLPWPDEEDGHAARDRQPQRR